MLSAARWSSIARSRAPASLNGHLVARRVGRVRLVQRYQSTASGGSSNASGSVVTHAAAGVAGGMVVLGAIYSYYHFSGAKKAVESAKSAHQYFQQTTQSIKEKAPKNPNEVIEFIRRVAKSQLGLIPGASSYVDSTLDTLDDLRETHGDDVNSILTDTYNEIQDILQGKDSGADLQTGMKIIIVVKQRMGELNEVARKAGKDAWGKFEEKNPQMAQVLGSRYYELREMAGRSGPETKKIFEETSQEVKDILSKGSTPDAIKQAQSLVKDKSSQIHDLAQKTSQKTWDKAVQQAGPYLEKLPEIKQLVSENASKFVAAGAARVGSSKSEGEEVLSKIKEVADKAGKEGLLRDKQKVEDLKQFIKTKAQEAEQKVNDQFAVSWEGLQEWVKSVPGGEETPEKLPDIQAFVELSQKRSEDATNLAKETYDEIFRVLQDKSRKAKKIAEDAKEEAEKSA